MQSSFVDPIETKTRNITTLLLPPSHSPLFPLPSPLSPLPSPLSPLPSSPFQTYLIKLKYSSCSRIVSPTKYGQSRAMQKVYSFPFIAHIDFANFFSSFSQMKFKELCEALTFDHYVNCLLTILEHLFEVMCSHYTMKKWHQDKQKESGDNKYFSDIHSLTPFLSSSCFMQMFFDDD